MEYNQYLEVFIEESKENLQSMNKVLLDLENDMSDLAQVNTIFRVAHTIKGMASTMNYPALAELTHQMENVLHKVRSKEMDVTDEVIDILFECFDTLEEHIKSIEMTTLENGQNDALVAKLKIMDGAGEKPVKRVSNLKTSTMSPVVEQEEEEVIETPVLLTPATDYVDVKTTAEVVTSDTDILPHLETLKDIVKQGKNVYRLHITLAETCVMKSVRVFIVFTNLEKIGQIALATPDTETLELEDFDLDFELIFVTAEGSEAVLHILENTAELADFSVDVLNEIVFNVDVADTYVAPPAVAVAYTNELEAVADLDDVISADDVLEDDYEDEDEDEEDTTPAFTPPRPVNAPVQAPTQAPREDKPTSILQSVNKKNSLSKPKTDMAQAAQKQTKTVRVDISRLDNLMNLVSELIIVKTGLDEYVSLDTAVEFNSSIEYLERITSSLHDAVMRVRMVPVETVFNRFPRMVRDTAKELGKKLKLTMVGEETEVDRTIVDELADPLIHLLRNSIDHGIEMPEVRQARGKDAIGNVVLKAYPEGNNVVIEISDDGGGIDANVIRRKVVEKGLMSAEDMAALSDTEAIRCLFLPGFSTAEKITDMSGRGVGLDVVKSKIHSIGGTVDIQTELGAYSRFIIRLPLTLAVIQALLVHIGEEKYALPLNNISEITTIKKADLNTIGDNEVILFREKTLPVIYLSEAIKIGDRSQTPKTKEDTLNLVIVKKGESSIGIVVDSLIGQQEIVIKSLGPFLRDINVIAGATILGNGGVALIIDPNKLF